MVSILTPITQMLEFVILLPSQDPVTGSRRIGSTERQIKVIMLLEGGTSDSANELAFKSEGVH